MPRRGRRAENEARNKTGKAKAESTGRVKRKEGAKESEVGRVAIFIPRSGQRMHAPQLG